MAVKGVSVAVMATGGILLWSALFNKTVTQTIQDLVRGEKPQPGPLSNAGGVAAGTGTITSAGSVAGPNPQGQAIAVDALAYQGLGYVFGGAPANGLGQWDCSSFANWVIGHDMGMSIPGYRHGSYTGAVHGPSTLGWLASLGTVTTRIPRKAVGAGDLCVWQTHMGIAINNKQMISAQNPGNGTQVSDITGFIAGEVLICLRLKETAKPRTTSGGRKK